MINSMIYDLKEGTYVFSLNYCYNSSYSLSCRSYFFCSTKKMRETSDRGGAFGGGSGGAVFGREKGLDKNSKIALTLGILFMFSCFLVTWIVA